MYQIKVVDAVTHQLTFPQIAKQLLAHFEEGELCVHVVIQRELINSCPSLLRNAISRLYRQWGLPSHVRYGIRCSEPMAYSFMDDRKGKYMAIAVSPWRSAQKGMQGAILIDIEGFTL